MQKFKAEPGGCCQIQLDKPPTWFGDYRCPKGLILPAVHCLRVVNWRGYSLSGAQCPTGLFCSSTPRTLTWEAQRSFHTGSRYHTDGQVDPKALGDLICSRPPPGHTRVLGEVRIYTGRPDSTKDPKTYSAHMRQCEAWGALRRRWSCREHSATPAVGRRGPAEQKGVDVELAIDFIAGAIDRSYDVGIIFSTDTDLRPAIEFVATRFQQYPRAEAAAWRGPGSNRALKARGSERLGSIT